MQNWPQRKAKQLLTFLLAAALMLNLVSCANQSSPKQKDKYKSESGLTIENIAEVSPPQTIQELRQGLETYQPKVTILTPQSGEILEDNNVSVKFQVQDLPIFKNSQLGLGPHLHVFLDNQPYQAVYDLNEPLVFSDLAPGTHTIRVFASRPWHESFKNEGAYAQTTFYIFTKTEENNPNPAQTLLTYSRPQGSYGAQPIMLDFYLTNAPLHLVAQKNPDDEIADWRIRCTVNGQSFIIDKWQPIYLQGFKPGKNWIKLELLDEQGNPLKNVYNSTVRVLNYEPNGKDPLSQLVRDELSVTDARGIVDPNYTAKVTEPKTLPTAVPTPIDEPAVESTPTPETPAPLPADVPIVEETPSEAEVTEEAETPNSEGFYNRFRRSDAEEVEPEPLPATVRETPTPEQEVTPIPESKAEVEPVPVPSKVTETPAPEPLIQEVLAPSVQTYAETPEEFQEKLSEELKVEVLPSLEEKNAAEITKTQPITKPKRLNFRKLLERFKLPGNKKVNSEPSLLVTPIETPMVELELLAQVSAETPVIAGEILVEDTSSAVNAEKIARINLSVE